MAGDATACNELWPEFPRLLFERRVRLLGVRAAGKILVMQSASQHESLAACRRQVAGHLRQVHQTLCFQLLFIRKRHALILLIQKVLQPLIHAARQFECSKIIRKFEFDGGNHSPT